MLKQKTVTKRQLTYNRALYNLKLETTKKLILKKKVKMSDDVYISTMNNNLKKINTKDQ